MTAITVPQKRLFDWKVFFFLLGLVITGAILKVPMVLVTGFGEAQALWPQIAVSLVLQDTILFGLLPLAIGLPLATRLGLGAPLIKSWLRRELARERLGQMVKTAAIASIALAVIGVSFLYVTAPMIAAELEGSSVNLAALERNVQAPLWAMFLVAISAGITEEVGFRLGAVTLLAWLGSLIWRPRNGRVQSLPFWLANILVALLFGMAHFSNIAAAGVPLVPGLVLRTLAGNGLAAVAFGWLYRRYGLSSAILAHFFLDMIMHVLFPIGTALLT